MSKGEQRGGEEWRAGGLGEGKREGNRQRKNDKGEEKGQERSEYGEEAKGKIALEEIGE